MDRTLNVDAVTLDVGGTLIAPQPSVGHIYAEVAARHGVTGVSPEMLNRHFAAAWRAKKNFNHTREEWAALVDETFAGLDPPPSRTFFPAIYERFAGAGAWRTYDDVVPTLDALASRGVRMGVVSNWDDRLRPLLRELRLESYFEIVVVSCEVGCTKPSSLIFQFAADALRLPCGSILHVGDSNKEDFEGATAAGLQALLLNRDSLSPGQTQISSLREVERLLCRAESS